MIGSEYHEGHTCPKQDTQRVDVARLSEAIRMIEGCRVFVTTREKIKHPEGTDLFDESVRIVADALPALLQQLADTANKSDRRRVKLIKAQRQRRELHDSIRMMAAEIAELRVDVETLVKMRQHWIDRTEATERAREEAMGLLREALTLLTRAAWFVGVAPKPESVAGRIAAFLAANGGQ